MILLALETATPVCSVALLRDDGLVAHASLHRPRVHAEHLVPMIADVLRGAGVDRSEVTGVAVSSGPGSYTGLRIGVSTAKGFASATGARLVSVPSLRALAERIRPAAARNDRIAAAFDARRDEAYAALYRVSGAASLVPVREAATIRAEESADWLDASAGNVLYLVGDGWVKMAGALGPVAYRLIEGENAMASATTVASLGAEKLARGDVEDIVTFEPYYLKEFVATKPEATAFEKLSF